MIVGNQASDHGEYTPQSLSRYLERSLPVSRLESGPACHLERSEGSLVRRARSFAALRACPE